MCGIAGERPHRQRCLPQDGASKHSIVAKGQVFIDAADYISRPVSGNCGPGRYAHEPANASALPKLRSSYAARPRNGAI